MATKSTHKGHCQWCNRLQMLPGGMLSKHGYEVRHRGQGGFFAGTCRGSGHLPFEQSCELIKTAIAAANASIEHIRKKIAERAQIDPNTTTKAWLHVYKRELSSRLRGSVYLWEEHELIQTGDSLHWHHYIVDGIPHRIHRSGTLADKVREGKAHRMQALAADAKELQDYVAWQENRIKSWAPAALMEIAS